MTISCAANVSFKDNSSWTNLTNLIYPVGAYYISNKSISPASKFGGTWSTLTGRFIYANNGTGTGGANNITLTAEQLPKHNHRLYLGWSHGDIDEINCLSYNSGSGNKWGALAGMYDAGAGHITKPNGTVITAATKAVSNMPAYKTAYVYYRTA